MLTYVDDCLHIHHNPNQDMKILNSHYRLKDGIETSTRYLGANINKVQLQDGSVAWSMTCEDYLRGAIKNTNSLLNEEGVALKMFGDGKRPYPSTYRPEMDITSSFPDYTVQINLYGTDLINYTQFCIIYVNFYI